MLKTDDVFIRMERGTGWFEPDLPETFGREDGHFMQNVDLNTTVYTKATSLEANPFIQKAVSNIGLLLNARIAPTWVVDDGSGQYTKVASLVLSEGAQPLADMRRALPCIDARADAVIGDANLALVGLCGLSDCDRGKHIVAGYYGEPYQIDFGTLSKGQPDYTGLRPDMNETEAQGRASAYLSRFDIAGIMACVDRVAAAPGMTDAQRAELDDFSTRIQANWEFLRPAPTAGISIGTGPAQGDRNGAQPQFI